MNIYFTNRSGFELVIEADNVKIVEDIESREYPKKEDGRTDWTKSPKRDVHTTYISELTSVLDDMIYHRVDTYDSSELVKRLFSKLPEDIAQRLSFDLYDEYGQHD